jgi:hypothetical protein
LNLDDDPARSRSQIEVEQYDPMLTRKGEISVPHWY